MSTLEFFDEENQRRIAELGNISASNDPLQQGYDETAQLIKGAQVIGAGRELGLDDDTTLKLAARKQRMDEARKQQRSNRSARKQGVTGESFANDEQIQEIDAAERRFQQENPLKAADPLSMLQLGADEADLQQIRAGKIENIQQVDQAGGGEGGRDRRRLQQQIKDRQALQIRASLPTAKGRSIRIEDSVPAGQPIPEDLREAAMLQELGLGYPDPESPKYKKDAQGRQRRSFGRPLKGADGEILEQRLSRVKRARQPGQTLDPKDVISVDKTTTPRVSGYRGIGDDGPEGPRNPMMASQRAGSAEYARLVEAVNSGQVQLTDEVAPGKTVQDLLTRMAQSQSGKAALDMAKQEAAMTSINDMRARKDLARQQLRQLAIEASAAGQPLTPFEAQSLLKRLEAPATAEDSRRKAERDALGQIASAGSTNEVIGETIMSDEAWKAKSGKMINSPTTAPEPTIFARNLDISSDPAVPYTDRQGNIAGYRVGAQILGDDVNLPGTDQMLNAPSPQQQSMVDFISQTMGQPEQGGVQDVVITDATRSFTDRVAAQRASRFGDQVSTVPQGIRSIGEAQQLMDSLIDAGVESGVRFSRPNPENPSQPSRVPAGERPTIADLMSTMRVDPSEQKNLANALYQMALAEGQDVNTARKQAYAARTGSYAPLYRPEGNSASVNLELQRRGTPAVDLPRQNILFDSPAGFFYDGVNPEYIRNSQRARIGEIGPDGQPKNINLQPALRGLGDPAAAAPFIGLVAGEQPVGIGGDPTQPNYRYRKGFGQDVSIEEGYTQMARDRATKKNPYNQKRVDANIATAREVERRQTAGEEDAAVKRIMSQAESASFDDRMRAQGAADYQQALKNEQFELQKIGAPIRSVTATQPTRPAQVAPSIAPDPWASTGPATESVLPPDLKAELNALNNPAVAELEGRTQGPTMRMGPRDRQQRMDQIRNFGTKNRRALTYGGLGAGIGAVLAGILGGGQDEKQEMYR